MAELEPARTLTDADLLAGIRELIRRVERGSQLRPRLLDITDAARYLGTSDKGVRALIAEGELHYIQRVPGHSPYRLDIHDLDRWIESNKNRTVV